LLLPAFEFGLRVEIVASRFRDLASGLVSLLGKTFQLVPLSDRISSVALATTSAMSFFFDNRSAPSLAWQQCVASVHWRDLDLDWTCGPPNAATLS
jgi:hypothetical protein